MKDDSLQDDVLPPLINVLYVHHGATTVAESAVSPGPHEAGKFLNGFFERALNTTFATCPAHSITSLDDEPQLLILALETADAADCALIARAAGAYPHTAIIALVKDGEAEHDEHDHLFGLGATDVVRYDELQPDLFRHVMVQVLRMKQRELESSGRSAYSESTGLFTGGLFVDLLSREIAAALRANTRLAVLCIEPVGGSSTDSPVSVVTTLARRLRDLVRTEDLLAQADATTVLLLQREVREDAHCLAFAERIQAALKPSLPVNIGIASAPESGLQAIGLIKAAKQTLADLRELPEPGIGLYHGDHRIELHPHPRTLDETVDLQKIWQRGELEVYFQPVVNRSRLTVIGFECLLRWNHPTRGLLTATEFLNADSPAMVPVGNWLIHQACEALSKWQAMGWQHLNIAVNISMTELRHKRFTAVLEEAIHNNGLSYQQLILELRAADLSAVTQTEMRRAGEDLHVAAAVNEAEDIVEVLEQLDLRGIRIALDNIGAGGSTTELLRRLPASMLKLDHDVISRLGHDAVAAAVVHGTAGIADSLALSLVAEGVENSAQLRHLLNVGVRLLQGNFLHEPMTARQVTDWLSAQPLPRNRSKLVGADG